MHCSFTVVTLGRFSRNRYWGEDETKSYRGPVCATTLIRADGTNILIDPALPGDKLAALLDGTTGLKPDEIHNVYITHAHKDHFVDLSPFINASFYCAPDELDSVRSQLDENEAERMNPSPDELIPGVNLIHLPGHTPGLAGLIFKTRDGVTAVVGDAVMTRDFFDERRGYFNCVDLELAKKSIEKLALTADIIVPGHGNYFINAKR